MITYAYSNNSESMLTKEEISIPSHLIQIGESFQQKYSPVLDFDGWRVAMLRHSEATDPEKLHQIEKHNETHEVFILSEGEADLVITDNTDMPLAFHVIAMRRNVAYNILPGVWHHVLLSKDAHIVIFEKSNTSRSNSNYHELDNQTIAHLKTRFRNLKASPVT
jgi:hypothetical protein